MVYTDTVHRILMPCSPEISVKNESPLADSHFFYSYYQQATTLPSAEHATHPSQKRLHSLRRVIVKWMKMGEHAAAYAVMVEQNCYYCCCFQAVQKMKQELIGRIERRLLVWRAMIGSVSRGMPPQALYARLLPWSAKGFGSVIL